MRNGLDAIVPTNLSGTPEQTPQHATRCHKAFVAALKICHLVASHAPSLILGLCLRDISSAQEFLQWLADRPLTSR